MLLRINFEEHQSQLCLILQKDLVDTQIKKEYDFWTLLMVQQWRFPVN